MSDSFTDRSPITVQRDDRPGQVEHEVVDGDHQLVDRGPAVHRALLDVHRELLVRLMAVGHQVVPAQAGELVHVPVKGLEVVPAPGAADAVDVVQSCGGKVREKTLSFNIRLVLHQGPIFEPKSEKNILNKASVSTWASPQYICRGTRPPYP